MPPRVAARRTTSDSSYVSRDGSFRALGMKIEAEVVKTSFRLERRWRVPLLSRRPRPHAPADLPTHRQHRLCRRKGRQSAYERLLRLESGRDRLYQIARERSGD